jgi:hypothetical protein
MHRQEFDELGECAVCHAEIEPGTDRAFFFTPERLLCFRCASERGGVYDADEETWTTPADTSDLENEQRPHP